MALNLIKLCVGADSVRDLEDWIKQKLKDKRKRGEKPEHIHRTRMVPKRADELTDGGSLYWVIRGEVMCRQRIRAIRPFRDKDGIGRCGVVLDPKVVLVAPRPFRAFQGWRYLDVKDAPRDLDKAAPGAAAIYRTLRRRARSQSRAGGAASVPCLSGLALPRREGRPARPRQGGAGRGGDAGEAAPRTARARLDVSLRRGPARVAA